MLLAQILKMWKITRGVELKNMILITCISNGIHRVCEEVHGKLENIDKIVPKTPSSIQIFKKEAPELPLPPRTGHKSLGQL